MVLLPGICTAEADVDARVCEDAFEVLEWRCRALLVSSLGTDILTDDP